MNYFVELNKINCNDKTEKKNGLTYLSWAFAWQELKKLYPKSFYTIYENADGMFYHTDGKTCWVKTGVTVVTDDGSVEHIEYLPVMDYRNKSIPVDNVTSFDVNKAIQRSLTKAVARHGLGLYIYAGEDIPSDSDESVEDRLEVAEMSTKLATPVQKKTILDMCETARITYEELFAKVGITDSSNFTVADFTKCVSYLKKIGK